MAWLGLVGGGVVVIVARGGGLRPSVTHVLYSACIHMLAI